jgi:hypothetical protein
MSKNPGGKPVIDSASDELKRRKPNTATPAICKNAKRTQTSTYKVSHGLNAHNRQVHDTRSKQLSDVSSTINSINSGEMGKRRRHQLSTALAKQSRNERRKLPKSTKSEAEGIADSISDLFAATDLATGPQSSPFKQEFLNNRSSGLRRGEARAKARQAFRIKHDSKGTCISGSDSVYDQERAARILALTAQVDSYTELISTEDDPKLRREFVLMKLRVAQDLDRVLTSSPVTAANVGSLPSSKSPIPSISRASSSSLCKSVIMSCHTSQAPSIMSKRKSELAICEAEEDGFMGGSASEVAFQGAACGASLDAVGAYDDTAKFDFRSSLPGCQCGAHLMQDTLEGEEMVGSWDCWFRSLAEAVVQTPLLDRVPPLYVGSDIANNILSDWKNCFLGPGGVLTAIGMRYRNELISSGIVARTTIALVSADLADVFAGTRAPRKSEYLALVRTQTVFPLVLHTDVGCITSPGPFRDGIDGNGNAVIARQSSRHLPVQAALHTVTVLNKRGNRVTINHVFALRISQSAPAYSPPLGSPAALVIQALNNLVAMSYTQPASFRSGAGNQTSDPVPAMRALRSEVVVAATLLPLAEQSLILEVSTVVETLALKRAELALQPLAETSRCAQIGGSWGGLLEIYPVRTSTGRLPKCVKVVFLVATAGYLFACCVLSRIFRPFGVQLIKDATAMYGILALYICLMEAYYAARNISRMRRTLSLTRRLVFRCRSELPAPLVEVGTVLHAVASLVRLAYKLRTVPTFCTWLGVLASSLQRLLGVSGVVLISSLQAPSSNVSSTNIGETSGYNPLDDLWLNAEQTSGAGALVLIV